MLCAVDVHYLKSRAVGAAVLFERWSSERPAREIVRDLGEVDDYAPGAFYRRELPCVVKLLATVVEPLTAIVVDGYVFLDGSGHRGLGAHLYDHLERAIAVIGVAKAPFGAATHAERVLRGQSRVPLFVTAAGIPPSVAADHVRAMHGPHRVPTLLRRVDQLSRGIASGAR